MKITRERLKQVIKEELEIAVGPSMPNAGNEAEAEHNSKSESDGHMAKSNLFKIIEYAHELYEIIDDNEDLEPWVEEKIAIAGYMMDSVGHYMRYEKHGEHEDAEGEADHLDMPGDEEHDMEGEEEGHGEEGDEEYLSFDDEESPEGEEDYEDEEENEYEEEDEEEERQMAEAKGHLVKGNHKKYVSADGNVAQRGLWANVELRRRREQRKRAKGE